jgi:phage replication initiation protein
MKQEESYITTKSNWGKELKEKRNEYGVSQNKLAVASGVSRGYLSDIENGNVTPSDNIKSLLVTTLRRFDPNASIDMVIDYVRVRFPTCDVAWVIKHILQMKIEYMIHEDYGHYTYKEQYYYADIVVYLSYDITKGVMIEMKGKGCRLFENFLLVQERTWYDFFLDCISADGVFKRLDLAINDKVGLLNIPELSRKCDKEECRTLFTSYQSYRSGRLVHHEKKPNMGHTLYLGSFRSNIYFCIYEKDYEQFIKKGIPMEESKVKNRFELRLKEDRALHAIQELLVYHDAERTAFGIINHYVRFVDKEEGKPREEWKTSECWENFIGEHRQKLRLTTTPEPFSLEKTLNWLRQQVAPTLKMIQILDEYYEMNVLATIIQEAHLTNKQEKLIEQLKHSVEEMTITDVLFKKVNT